MARTKTIAPFLAILASATCAVAGWEDVGAPPARRTYSQPATITPATTSAKASAAPASRPAAQPAQPVRSAGTSYQSDAPQTVREAAQRRAAARDAAARAQAERERALVDEERRRIDARSRAAQQPARQPSRQPARTPPPAREEIYDEGDSPYDNSGNVFFVPFFDAKRESDNWLHAIYMTPAKAANGNDLTMAEGHAHISMVDAHDFLSGDFKMALNLKGLGFIDDAEYETLPYVFLDLDIDVSQVWRFINDFSLEVGARPGVYGDPENFDASLFSCPFRGCFYYSFAPEFAIRAGAEARLGWDMPVMPLVGFGWAPSDYFYLEAGVPRSTATLHLGPFDIYGLAQWDNATYAMEDKGAKPETMTVDFWRLGGGLTINFFDAFRIGGEAGYIMGREFEAEGSAGKGKIELENSPYFGATLGARF